LLLLLLRNLLGKLLTRCRLLPTPISSSRSYFLRRPFDLLANFLHCRCRCRHICSSLKPHHIRKSTSRKLSNIYRFLSFRSCEKLKSAITFLLSFSAALFCFLHLLKLDRQKMILFIGKNNGGNCGTNSNSIARVSPSKLLCKSPYKSEESFGKK
jgi:hypothetical protein